MSFRRDIQTTAFVQTWVRLILFFKCITLLQAAPWVPRFIGFHHCRYVCRLYVPSLAKCSACTCLHRHLWLEDVKSSSGGAKGRSQIESLGHGVLIEKLKTRSDWVIGNLICSLWSLQTNTTHSRISSPRSDSSLFIKHCKPYQQEGAEQPGQRVPAPRMNTAEALVPGNASGNLWMREVWDNLFKTYGLFNSLKIAIFTVTEPKYCKQKANLNGISNKSP